MSDLKQAAETLAAILETLNRANESGIIKDTIWHSDHETLFDFIESERAALAAEPSREPVACDECVTECCFRNNQCLRTDEPLAPAAPVVEHADGELSVPYRPEPTRVAVTNRQPAAPVMPDGWRELALRFDEQRMKAMWHLQALLQDPVKHADEARNFLAAAPTPSQAGEQR